MKRCKHAYWLHNICELLGLCLRVHWSFGVICYSVQIPLLLPPSIVTIITITVVITTTNIATYTNHVSPALIFVTPSDRF